MLVLGGVNGMIGNTRPGQREREASPATGIHPNNRLELARQLFVQETGHNRQIHPCPLHVPGKSKMQGYVPLRSLRSRWLGEFG